MTKDIISEDVKKSFLLEVKQGKLRKLLNIKDNENLDDKYTSGAKLAKDLLKKVDYAAAIKMLVFAANMNPDIKVLKAAVNACKRLKDN